MNGKLNNHLPIYATGKEINMKLVWEINKKDVGMKEAAEYNRERRMEMKLLILVILIMMSL